MSLMISTGQYTIGWGPYSSIRTWSIFEGSCDRKHLLGYKDTFSEVKYAPWRTLVVPSPEGFVRDQVGRPRVALWGTNGRFEWFWSRFKRANDSKMCPQVDCLANSGKEMKVRDVISAMDHIHAYWSGMPRCVWRHRLASVGSGPRCMWRWVGRCREGIFSFFWSLYITCET